MKPLIAFVFAAAMAGSAFAAEPEPLELFEAADVTLEEFKWIKRPLVVFADSPLDPAFVEQIELLTDDAAQLAERDVVVIVDSDPSLKTEIRSTLRPRGFSFVLIEKDGEIKLRKPSPWSVRELSHSIDKMPIRLKELRDAKRAE